MDALKIILCGVIGYLLGTISTGTIVARRSGKDLRKLGSGNTGSTNVLRNMGWKAGVVTLLGDALKGVLATLVGKWLGGELGMYVGALAAVAGHDFPVFSGFKGGKGIATSLGVTIVISPLTALCIAVIAIGLTAITRMMALGSLVAAASYPLLMWAFLRPGETPWMRIAFGCVMALMAILCHRQNIMRLFRGEENKLDFAKINRLSKKKDPQ